MNDAMFEGMSIWRLVWLYEVARGEVLELKMRHASNVTHAENGHVSAMQVNDQENSS